MARPLHVAGRYGFAVAAIDHPGHGERPGPPSTSRPAPTAGRRSPPSAAAGRAHADRLGARLPHVPRPTRPEAPPAARTRWAVSRSQRALRLGVRVWVG